jgi:purine-binding chemotaxis protein CheW
MKQHHIDFDWDVARDRLRVAEEALEGSATLSAERTTEILETRARTLAKRQEEPAAAPSMRVLVFQVGAERYALDTERIHGVLRLAELTPLPDAPPHVVGITNIRGEIVPLFDLRLLLGRGRQALTDLARVIVVGEEQPEFGLIADEASEIVDLPLHEIHAPSASVTGADREVVHGVTKDAVTVLASDALCRDPRLFITTRNHEERT